MSYANRLNLAHLPTGSKRRARTLRGLPSIATPPPSLTESPSNLNTEYEMPRLSQLLDLPQLLVAEEWCSDVVVRWGWMPGANGRVVLLLNVSARS